jgi:3-deoxy-manno-octulosonate cytidylyltransferase (CMP-KDO synthetase)
MSIVHRFYPEHDMAISPADSLANKGSGIVVIPARLQSSRFPRKLLLNDTGRPLLAYTIEQAQMAVSASHGLLREVIVACDDEQLIEVARAVGVRGVITSDSHPNGTSRIAEAIQHVSNLESLSFALNVQGDQPELQPQAMLQVVTDLIKHPECDMATAAVEYQISETPGGRGSCRADFSAARQEPRLSGTTKNSPGDCAISNPNVVKVKFDSFGHATEFWRQSATTDKRPPANILDRWYHHVGIYAYRTGFLKKYVAAPPSVREQKESLEQLRALEIGAMIRVSLITAEQAGRAIDSPADYADFTDRMRQQKAAAR